MREHRLIERMVNVIKREVIDIKEQKRLDPTFIDDVIDFFRTYADRCHHGKEEVILFKELSSKDMEEIHEKTMDELKKEHIFARKMVANLKEANRRYVHSAGNVPEIVDLLEELTVFYRKHIEKEDKRFFYPSVTYFSQPELDAMLESFWDFDKKMIHEKYEKVVTEKEGQKPSKQIDVGEKMQKYVCSVCGYIYDPKKGDLEHEIPPGTDFSELPEDWVCPICFAPKKAFEKVAVANTS